MIIKIKVKPNCKFQRIEKISDQEFVIHVKSPPEKGKANKEIVELLAEYFNVSKNRVEIIKGLKSKEKVVKINEV